MRYISNEGKISLYNYPKEILDYVVNEQLLSSDRWALLVNQYRIKSDVDNGWRGEFWGKLMRGATLCYRVNKSPSLYKVISSSVKDLLSLDNGSYISSYPKEKELTCWDVWGRKYVLLGLGFFYDICKNDSLKKSVVRFMKRQADGLIKELKTKGISLVDTSNIYGSLNSCSIINSFMKLYNITNEKRYLDFVSNVVNDGLCRTFNLIEACLDPNLYPYQFKETKAYEMISCIEGLLEYYKVVKVPLYLNAVKSFTDKVIYSDLTIIGCCGCKSEFFDNSSLTQTNELDDIAQETCVSVNFVSLLANLFMVDHDAKYISLIERSVYNSIYGSVNNEKQTMKDCKGNVWYDFGPVAVPHESFAFDSYSPLVNSSRGKQVGGFMRLENERSFGCCAAIGAYGVAIGDIITMTEEDNHYYVNIYQKALVKFNNNLSFKIDGSVYKCNSNRISIKGKGHFAMHFIMPNWSNMFKIFINKQIAHFGTSNGYAVIERDWNNDVIEIKLSARMKTVMLNDRIAFVRGNIVYARDERFNDFDKELVFSDFKKSPSFKTNKVSPTKFKTNMCFEVVGENSSCLVCDYSQAGKTFDIKPNLVTVWQKYKIKK